MKPSTCQHCGQQIELDDRLTVCPHCNREIRDLDDELDSDEVDEFDLATDDENQDSAEDEVRSARTVIENEISEELRTLNTDPMATLEAPRATGPGSTAKYAPSRSADELEKTLGFSDPTVGDEKRDTDRLDELDPTLVPPKPAPDDTVLNPNAELEAVEKYSAGLKTVIPSRSISREAQPGQSQDYKVEKRLGSGAFGVVFRAVQVPLERNVAVKVLQGTEDESASRTLQLENEFLREAQFTGRLEHPNIVPIHDIGLTVNPDGKVNPFYVMKEIRGESWLDTIHDKPQMENLAVFKHVVNAIGFAHARNIIHCDLKPANVMLGEFGEVLVVDWGQAIDLAQEDTLRPGGTPAYISPEMARYWVDKHLDNKPDSPARALVGHRSDVYLLGGLLFEIVTGKPPHGDPSSNDSPYEVMRQAAENEIVSSDEFANEELLQIALAALRVGDRESIETVEALMSAILHYENRRLSIELQKRAYEILAVAKTKSDYDEFQRARFGFEESLEKWTGNEPAKTGLRDARLSCAELALADQNFDLGIGMLDDVETPEEKSVKQQLVTGRNNRDRRKKLVRWLALGLISSICVGIAVNAFMINENYKSAKLRDLALAEKRKVEQEIAPLRSEVETKKQQIALNEQQIERNEREIAQFPLKFKQEQEKFESKLIAEKQKFETQLADEQASLARKLKQEQERLDQQLDLEQQKFETETKQLVQQKDELISQVVNLNESSRFLRYKNRLTSVIQKLQTGDYRETRRLLDAFEDKSDWEVARLNLLAHREIESIFADKLLTTFAASADGSRFAMVFDDQIEIRDTVDFNKVLVSIPLNGATATALSADGKKLAIGKPSASPLQPGTIWIVDLSQPGTPAQDRTLDAQSRLISKLGFSSDSSRFLAVGAPSKIGKSSRTTPGDQSDLPEEELMVWDADWQRIDVKLIVENGSQPLFSSAVFSDDGRRILTTHPDGLSRDQRAHVFEETGKSYQWIATSPVSGINVAIFADAGGNRVVGCVREGRSGTFSLASWNPGLNNRSKSTEFISASAENRNGQVRTIAQLDQKALSICRADSWIVTGGLDKKITLWDWTTKTPTRFGGHSRDVDFCALVPGSTLTQNILISVSSGPNPEILKTDLATYRPEVETKTVGRVSPNDQPSPTTFSYSQLTKQLTMGNDLGQVSVERETKGKRPRIQWEVSAWKNHFLSDDFLFAQSRGDFFYKFNRKTGALQSVLTQLAIPSVEGRRSEIVRFEVSDDGSTALVVTSDRAPEFHIWNLETETRIRTIDYGQENVFGTGTEKELLTLRLSPDGRWVIGGKVGVFAWSTQDGSRKPLTQPGSDMARIPVSTIEFLDGGSRFLVSWKDRVDLFDLNSDRPAKRFNTRNIAYSKNEPNLFGARNINGQLHVLARSAGTSKNDSSISLINLQSNAIIQNFPLGKFASFSKSDGDHVLVVNKPAAATLLEKWNALTGQTQRVDVGAALQNRFDDRFRSIDHAFESKNGTLTLQASSRNVRNSLRRDWNTVSINKDLAIGPVRVIAKPEIEYAATSGERTITLDNGTIRFWKLLESSVQPDGIVEGFYRTCKLSPDEQTLLAVSEASNEVIGFDPATGEIRFTRQPKSKHPITTIQWHPDSRQIGIGMNSGEVEVWKAGDSLGEPELSFDFERVFDSPVSEIHFAKDSTSILAIAASQGENAVLRWHGKQVNRIAFGHADGQKIVTGDISADGNRIVTGTAKGRLTIWNSKPTATADSQTVSDQQSAERELLNLGTQHQSSNRFARFFSGGAGQTEIVSAESSDGENQYLVWKTNSGE